MATVTISKIRKGTDIQLDVRIKGKDGIVLSFKDMSSKEAELYCVEQKSFIKHLATTVDEIDNTLLHVTFDDTQQDYIGTFRAVLIATLNGKTITADALAFQLVDFTDEEGTATVETIDVNLEVGSISSSVIADLVKLLNDTDNTVEANETSRKAAELLRVSAENSRVEAENARVTNENGRIAFEKQRKVDEDVRKSEELTRERQEQERLTSETNREDAEEQRVAAEDERVSEETTRGLQEVGRVDNEKARVANESARQTSETSRSTAENARSSAETQRANAENSRIANENTRISSENTRISNENTRISNEAARVTAESKRDGRITDIEAYDTMSQQTLGQVIAQMASEIKTLMSLVDNGGDHKAHNYDALDLSGGYKISGFPIVLHGAGVPSADTIPAQNGVPAFIGQIYIDTTSTTGGPYFSWGVTSVSDWHKA